MAFNAWAKPSDTAQVASPAVPQYAPQEINRYSVPSPGDAYMTTPAGGWAPTTREAVGNTPDPGRLGDEPLYQRYPTPNRPPEDWYGSNSADQNRRARTLESVRGAPWQENLDGGGLADPTPRGARRFAPNPREIPGQPTRVTETLSPASYSFFRHMGTDQPNASEHYLNGMHFSMADHRRNYPILGTTPARKPGAGTRNTYRLPPTPWDGNIVDMPPPTATGMPQAQTQTGYSAPRSGMSSGRLM